MTAQNHKKLYNLVIRPIGAAPEELFYAPTVDSFSVSEYATDKLTRGGQSNTILFDNHSTSAIIFEFTLGKPDGIISTLTEPFSRTCTTLFTLARPAILVEYEDNKFGYEPDFSSIDINTIAVAGPHYYIFTGKKELTFNKQHKVFIHPNLGANSPQKMLIFITVVLPNIALITNNCPQGAFSVDFDIEHRIEYSDGTSKNILAHSCIPKAFFTKEYIRQDDSKKGNPLAGVFTLISIPETNPALAGKEKIALMTERVG